MKISERILSKLEESKKHKGIAYKLKKKGSSYYAEIEGEQIEDTLSKSEREAERKTREYIDAVM